MYYLFFLHIIKTYGYEIPVKPPEIILQEKFVFDIFLLHMKNLFQWLLNG
ncbi:hypothetical protein C723_0462 [Christiangramia flava JLT2011]|nr:hypothetical protein C723_0462 [Christiangramia flava JLT2011]